jgi:hypothetical protein
MNKCTWELTLVELFSIKHGLQSQLKAKQERIEEIYKASEISSGTARELVTLTKDIQHEKELIDRCESSIKTIKPRRV